MMQGDGPRNRVAAEAELRVMQDYLMDQARTVGPGEQLTLPDGRRLLRFFAGYGGLPVWESFTDNYPFQEDQLVALGVDAELVRELQAWDDANLSFQDEWRGTPAEARWIAQRVPLIRRLRAALGEGVVLYADGD